MRRTADTPFIAHTGYGLVPVHLFTGLLDTLFVRNMPAVAVFRRPLLIGQLDVVGNEIQRLFFNLSGFR